MDMGCAICRKDDENKLYDGLCAPCYYSEIGNILPDYMVAGNIIEWVWEEAEKTKECRGCGEIYPDNKMYFYQSGRGGSTRNWCKECYREKMRRRYEYGQ